jgi:hypothetical protein
VLLATDDKRSGWTVVVFVAIIIVVVVVVAKPVLTNRDPKRNKSLFGSRRIFFVRTSAFPARW